ncbi:head-tail joining protein [Marinobacter adhaerens]|uniref:head-tail joining protein n=1 Tax=Marinobacter adhaerens TaxID=1033846 RepID=UPI003D28C96A
MPALDWENLDDFLDDEEFATEAQLFFQSGGSKPVTGIFDDPYLNAQIGEYEMDSSRPRFMGKLADLKDAKRGDTITIDGITYDVLTPAQSDGTGMASLDLAEQ